jgi:hypothetical protein
VDQKEMDMKRKKVFKKLKKTYIKMLYAFSNGMIARGYELEDKAIRLELELKDEK